MSGGNSGSCTLSDKTTTTGGPEVELSRHRLGAMSSPVTAPDGTIYFTDAKNSEFQGIAPGATSATMKWNFKGRRHDP